MIRPDVVNADDMTDPDPATAAACGYPPGCVRCGRRYPNRNGICGVCSGVFKALAKRLGAAAPPGLREQRNRGRLNGRPL